MKNILERSQLNFIIVVVLKSFDSKRSHVNVTVSYQAYGISRPFCRFVTSRSLFGNHETSKAFSLKNMFTFGLFLF